MASYLLAVSISIGMVATLRKSANIMLAGKTGAVATFATYTVNYLAASSSSAANVIFVRRGEMATGANVCDESTGESFGKSQVAATTGVLNTGISRVIQGIPIFYFPILM